MKHAPFECILFVFKLLRKTPCPISVYCLFFYKAAQHSYLLKLLVQWEYRFNICTLCYKRYSCSTWWCHLYKLCEVL